MSISLITAAFKAKVGNPTRKLILIKLADHANDAGECWPSVQHIADQCEASKSSIKSHLKILEKEGYLKKIHRKKGSLNQSNIYILNLSDNGSNFNPSRSNSAPLSRSNADLGRSNSNLGRSNADLGGGSNSDPRNYHSLETSSKHNVDDEVIDDDIADAPGFTPEDLEFAKSMFESVKSVMPKTKPPNFETWAKDIRLMRERDNHSLTEIQQVFAWANKDEFWSTNIRSPCKLRQKFAVLHVKSCGSNSNPGNQTWEERTGVTGVVI